MREVSFSPVNSNSNAAATDSWGAGSLGAGTLGAGWLVGASGGLLGLAYVVAALVYMRTRRLKNKKRLAVKQCTHSSGLWLS